MKIVSWNVNGIRSCGQKGLFELWERENPDLLCLQETKAHPDQLEDPIRTPLGWQSYWSAAQRKGYSGTVTYTRRTPDEVRYGIDILKYDAEGRFVITRFGDLWVYNVYFPNGSAGEVASPLQAGIPAKIFAPSEKADQCRTKGGRAWGLQRGLSRPRRF